MLAHLGEEQAAGRIQQAIVESLRQGILTPDLGGTATTADVGRAVVERLS
jgi:tartrate dehydrogenase/decarboxylase/D-malate dehydrogenase